MTRVMRLSRSGQFAPGRFTGRRKTCGAGPCDEDDGDPAIHLRWLWRPVALSSGRSGGSRFTCGRNLAVPCCELARSGQPRARTACAYGGWPPLRVAGSRPRSDGVPAGRGHVGRRSGMRRATPASMGVDATGASAAMATQTSVMTPMTSIAGASWETSESSTSKISGRRSVLTEITLTPLHYLDDKTRFPQVPSGERCKK